MWQINARIFPDENGRNATKLNSSESMVFLHTNTIIHKAAFNNCVAKST